MKINLKSIGKLAVAGIGLYVANKPMADAALGVAKDQLRKRKDKKQRRRAEREEAAEAAPTAHRFTQAQ